MPPVMTPLEELRHSASHILATAVLRLFPDAKLDIGPPTDTGFYYDIDLDHKLTAEDLVADRGGDEEGRGREPAVSSRPRSPARRPRRS